MYTSITLAAALALGAPALKDRPPAEKGPGYLGIMFQKDDGGLIVTEVKADGPAAKAGLKANDLIVLSGVLYHLSDMLVGLYALRRLLKPGGVLLIESNAVGDDDASYANFGRFFAGMWWQPTTLCIRDLCAFMGYEGAETSMYRADRCVGRAVRGKEEPSFRRGLNWDFADLRDSVARTLDPSVMAPARRP